VPGGGGTAPHGTGGIVIEKCEFIKIQNFYEIVKRIRI
jgi:hypothetical protein